MPNYDIKFRHLRIFMEVARQRSVVNAAKVIHISQPAVTKTIGELERTLGVKLFEREGRGIKLTAHGEIFMRHAGSTVLSMQRAIDSVTSLGSATSPPVRIGALPTVSSRVLPKAVELFTAQNTGSRIKIVTGENYFLLDELRVGHLDFVVGRFPDPERLKGFLFEPLYFEPIAFVVRDGHPLLQADPFDLSRLREFMLLMPPQEAVIRTSVQTFLNDHGIPDLPGNIETISDSFGRACVRSSQAVWIISEGVVGAELASGEFRKLPVDTSDTLGAVGLTMKKDVEPSSAAEIFALMIRQVCRSLT
jgi:LysR family pca operon transcriptional activator